MVYIGMIPTTLRVASGGDFRLPNRSASADSARNLC